MSAVPAAGGAATPAAGPHAGWWRLAVPVGLIGGFLALALPRLSQIAGQDEILHYVGLGQRLYEQGFRQPGGLITFSPHLYGWLICLSHRACGPGLVAARVPGALAWALALALVWWWLARPAVGSDLPARAATVALLAGMPLAVQAGAIVDIDNTVLVPAVLLLSLGVVHLVERPQRLSFLAVAGLMALALWCRLTTPLIVAPAFLAYAGLRRRRLQPVATTAAALGLGCLAFLGTWWLYCRVTGVSFSGPFRYLVESFGDCTVSENRGIRPGKIALTLGYTALWIGPWVGVLWAWSAFTRARRFWQTRQVEPVDALLLAGALVFCGYCVVGGTIFGFPKYHCPAIPLLLIAGGLTLAGSPAPAGRRGWLTCLGLALCGAALQAGVVGDPLHVLRVDLREAAFCGRAARGVVLQGVVLPLGIAGGLSAALAALAWRLRLAPVSWAIVSLALGMNLAFAGLQQVAGYQTGYNYGDRGEARTVAAFLAARLPPEASAVVPGEVVYLLGRPAVRHVRNELWLDEAALRQELERPDIAAAAISLLTNTMAQVQTLQRAAAAVPALQRVDLGRYIVFIKSGAGSPPIPTPQGP